MSISLSSPIILQFFYYLEDVMSVVAHSPHVHDQSALPGDLLDVHSYMITDPFPQYSFEYGEYYAFSIVLVHLGLLFHLLGVDIQTSLLSQYSHSNY